MIDRNDLEFRIAQHHERVAQVNLVAWWRQAERQHPLRSRAARLLVVLANRLAPWMTVSITPASPHLQVGSEQS